MGTSYRDQDWSLRTGPRVAGFAPTQGSSLIPRGSPNAFNPTDDPNRDFPVYYNDSNAIQNGGTLVPPTSGNPIKFGTKGSLLRLPKAVFLCTNYFQFVTCIDPTIRDHFVNMGQQLANSLAPFGVRVYRTGAFGGLASAVTDGSSYVGGDCYFIHVANHPTFCMKTLGYINNWRRDYVNNQRPSGSFVDTPLGPSNLTNDLSLLDVYAGQWASAVTRFRNFHGLFCVCPLPRETVNIPDVTFDSAGDQILEPTCPLHAPLFFHVTPPSATIEYWTYPLPDYDKESDSVLAGAFAFVEKFNRTAPDTRGDASWEFATVAADQDPSWFADRVKAWLGVG